MTFRKCMRENVLFYSKSF